MEDHRRIEVTVQVNDVNDLFRERAFDPFTDDVGTVPSIAAMAQLPHLVSSVDRLRLRILLPGEQLAPQTEARVKRALLRYCYHMIAQARRKLSAMRWVGVRTLGVGLLFFAVSLAASTAVQRALWIPEELRVLASESLIVAGWVLLWQPLDTLVSGWWPQWEEERTFKAIRAIPVSVHACDPRSAAQT
jgi:hypothetical protein